MGLLETIKQKIETIKSDENALETEIENSDEAAFEDSKKVLKEIEDLDQNFVDLLLSDNAQQTIERAVEIIEWEKELSEFLNEFSKDFDEVKEALVNQDHQKFNGKVNKLRSDIKQFSSQRQEIEMDEKTMEAVNLLSNLESIESELEWFEKTVNVLENEESQLSNYESEDEIHIEEQEIRKIEQTIPQLESQINRLSQLAETHENIRLEPGDFDIDISSDLLNSFQPENEREKAELEYLISLVEEMKEFARENKNPKTRRNYLKMVAKASTLVAGSYTAAQATEFYPGEKDQYSGEWSKQDQLDLESLTILYEIDGEGNQAEMMIEIANTGSEILNIAAAVEMPAEWIQESPDMSVQANTEITTQLGKEFHLAPEATKELDMMISKMVNDTRPTIHLEIEWSPRNGEKRSINEPIEVN